MAGLVLSVAAGAAAAPKAQRGGPIFYPPLPNPPRLQFLTGLTSAADVGAKQGAFAKFVVGAKDQRGERIGKAYGVALWHGQVFAIDSKKLGYGVFDMTKHSFRFVPGEGAGRMQKPINICLDAQGNRYVTDTARKQVLVFDAEDNFVRAFGKKGDFTPSGVAIARDHLYVTDIEHHMIHALDLRNGSPAFFFGQRGKKDGQFESPTNICAGSDNTLYVTDTGNARVQVFDLRGHYLRTIGGIGDGPGHFARPKGVAVDRDGRAYVVDAAFENVQIFDNIGRLLLFFGEAGARRDNLNLPAGIAVDYESAAAFQKMAAPNFKVQYVVAVGNQFGNSMVTLYGFGDLAGAAASAPAKPAGR